ncbi:MAG: ABC transporter ATP-binding protein [Armatimonadetes bacterium]|jgi:putative ABC transport system ATP-binding protein|nr:ABC transporter ATP-binding protein [Armatimonadota bacterium]
MSDTVLEAQDVWRTYRRDAEEIHALAGMSLTVRSGEMVGIVGRSGSGKTTFLNQVGCLDRPSRGSLRVLGTEVTALPEKELVAFRRDRIGFIFQLFYLIPTLTVRENIELPLVFARRRDPERVAALIEKVGLGANADAFPDQLNGGDMQRVAIARALVNQPKLLLADEPTGRLEHRSRDAILAILRDLQREGLAILIATHDLSLAQQTDRVVELRDGRIRPRD